MLYGVLKSFWIRLKLSQSISWELRPYFTLIPDPVSGCVIVSAKRLRLTDLGLWRRRPGQPIGRARHKKLHVLLYRLRELAIRWPGYVSSRLSDFKHLIVWLKSKIISDSSST